MKKLIALILALIMALSMTTMTFAEQYYNPGQEITFDVTDLKEFAALFPNSTSTLEANLKAAQDILLEKQKIVDDLSKLSPDTSKVDAINKRINELKPLIDDLPKQKAEKQGQIDTLTAKLPALNQAVTEKNAVVLENEKAVNDLKHKIGPLKDALDVAQKAVDYNQKILNDLISRKEKLPGLIDKEKNILKKAALEVELAALIEVGIPTQQAVLKASQDTLTKAINVHKPVLDQLTAAEEALAAAQAAQATAQGELNAANASIAALTEEINNIDKQLTDAQAELLTQQQALEVAKKELDDKANQIAQDLTVAKAAQDKAKADVEAAQKAVDSAKKGNIERASYYIDSEYFNLVVKIEKGREHVEKWELKDGEIVITLKKNKDLVRPKIPNLIFKEIKIVSKRKQDLLMSDNKTKVTLNRGDEFAVTPDLYCVGWNTADKNPVGGVIDVEEGIYKFDDSTDYDLTGFRFGDDAYAELRVFKGESFYMSYDTDPNLKVVKANPDADLRFVNIYADFGRNADFEFYAEKDEYVYEYKDGKLTPTTLSWSKDDWGYTGRRSKLGVFVISDVKLKNLLVDKDKAEAAEKGASKNPNTGI